jgi:maltose/maltodextrin transport system permease protein
MAVEKRKYWLRHIILIAIVVVVLFPMVWLVSTSIRRDQAAFSSNLFSNRVTLQHYRNLLFPERSVGRLILDLQSATYATGDYREKSQEDLKKTVERYLAKFDSLMVESEVMVAAIDGGTTSIENDLTDKDSLIIKEMNELRLKDKNLFEERLKEIGEVSEVKTAYAIGEILQTTSPSLERGYQFYLDLLGERAAPISDSLERYRKLYEEVFIHRDETISAIETLEFENKDEVINSLESIQNYISLSEIDYSEWRKVEWLRVINRYLRDLESSMPEDRAAELNRVRTSLYDSFKSAGEAWEAAAAAAESVSEQLYSLAGEAFGAEYCEYIEATERLSVVESTIESTRKSLAVSESALAELEDSLQIAMPTLVSETRKLSALILPLQIVISKGIENRTAVSEAKLMTSLNGIISARETIDIVERQLSQMENIRELSAALSELSGEMAWFSDNREALLGASGNSEVSNGADAINTVLSNLSRILPVLEISVSEYVEVSENTKELRTELESLKAESELLNEKISSLQEEVDRAEDEYAKALEAVKIRMAMLSVEEEINSLDEARDYVLRLRDILNDYFKIRSSSRYRALTWYDDFARANTEAKEGTVLLNQLISSMRSMKDELALKVNNYIDLRFLGTSVTLEDFGKMQETYNSFFQQVNAKYQRASRLISDLIEKPASYSSSYSQDLREIDKALFRTNQIWAQKESTYFYFVRWLLNSVIVALSVSLISVAVASLAAYPFSRMRFRGRKQGLLGLLLIQMFPTIMFMVALYALLQFMGSLIPFLGLNTLGGLIFAYSGGIAFNIWLIKGYYDTISNSLEEAAMIDGATKFQAFSKVILPLARPILAVVAILTFMNIFNEYLIARILLQDMNKWTYAVGLWQFSGRFETSWGPFTAAALIGAVPMVIFFLVLQDYIVGGLTQGGVKE